MKLKISYYWIITLMLLETTALSFLDRQILSISIIKIKEDLGITDIEYGFINSGFLISYTIMFTLGGILIDRYGSRIGLGFSVAFWSFAVFYSTPYFIFKLSNFIWILNGKNEKKKFFENRSCCRLGNTDYSFRHRSCFQGK